MLSVLIAIASIAQIILSLFVFFRSSNNLSNRLFFFIGVSTLGWALADYLSAVYISSPNVVYMARAVLFFVVLQNAFFYMFARTFPKATWQHSKKWLMGYGFTALVVAAATLTPFMFQSVETQGNTSVTKVGPLMVLFVAQIFFSVIVIFTALIRKMRRTRGAPKAQLQILLFAAFLLWIIVPITNFGITQLTGTTIFTKYAPVYTLAFTGIIAYAIVSQKLFDIRAAAARSVGYVLVLGLTALVYSVAFFGVIDVFFAGKDYQTLRQVLQVIVVSALALSFQSLKQYFDRLTTSLFYRDSYDAGEVLDKISAVAVAEISLRRILGLTSSILAGALKCSFVEFALLEDSKLRLEGGKDKAGHLEGAEDLAHHLKAQQVDLLVADELSPSHQAGDSLRRHKIALSLRLKTQQQEVGYILIGEKRSGDVYSKQDKRLLITVANELAIAIQNALRFEEIERFNVTLQQKVNEATRQLRRTNEKLKQLDETKDDFISMASHQLRTPLTSVKGYLSMVLEGDAGKISKSQRQMLDQAYFSSQRMVYLIADLLNVSRLKTGKFLIDPAPINLATMVEEEVKQLEETAASRSLHLSYKKPASFPRLMLDDTKTRQVVMNFIDNAIYYTAAGGHIVVRLIEKPSSVELRVEDDGIGVPRSERHHLFTKFYRAGNARKKRPDGTGLGLFMARKVVVAQGGAVIFDSQEGKGSTFGFSFSKAKLAVPSTPPPARPRSPATTKPREVAKIP